MLLGRYTVRAQLGVRAGLETLLAVHQDAWGKEHQVVVRRFRGVFAQPQPRVADVGRVISALKHPNLVQTLELAQLEGDLLAVTAFADGFSVAALASELRRQRQPLPDVVAARIISAAAMGLEAAHALSDANGRPYGLVHRDVNAANLLVTRFGEVQVCDFGVGPLTGGAVLGGRVPWRVRTWAPELARSESVDQRVDQFPLAVCLYELVTGTTLFGQASDADALRALQNTASFPRASDRRPDLSRTLDHVIAKAMSPRREDRFNTMGAFRQALEGFIVEAGQRPSNEQLAQFVHGVLRVSMARRDALTGGVARPTTASVVLGKEEPPTQTQRAPDLFAGPTQPNMRAIVGGDEEEDRTAVMTLPPAPSAPRPNLFQAAPSAPRPPTSRLQPPPPMPMPEELFAPPPAASPSRPGKVAPPPMDELFAPPPPRGEVPAPPPSSPDTQATGRYGAVPDEVLPTVRPLPEAELFAPPPGAMPADERFAPPPPARPRTERLTAPAPLPDAQLFAPPPPPSGPRPSSPPPPRPSGGILVPPRPPTARLDPPPPAPPPPVEAPKKHPEESDVAMPPPKLVDAPLEAAAVPTTGKLKADAAALSPAGESSDHKKEGKRGKKDKPVNLPIEALPEASQVYSLPADMRPPEKPKRRGVLFAGLGVVVLALAGGGWFFTQRGADTPTQPVAKPVEPTPVAVVDAGPAPVAAIVVSLTPISARLTIDGERVSSGRNEVTPGPHEVAAEATGYTPSRLQLTVAPGETRLLEMALEQQSNGSLELISIPAVTATLEATGVELGTTPLTVLLPAGRHVLHVVNAKAKIDTTVTVEVKPRVKVTRKLKLK